MRAFVTGAAALSICSCAGDESFEQPSAFPAGAASVDDHGTLAFSQPLPTLPRELSNQFFVGNSLFSQNWVIAPSSTDARDGLGPLFNAQACSSCHFKDGRGAPPTEDPRALGLLFRVSAVGASGELRPHPVFGDQLHPRAVGGVEAEGEVGIELHDVTGQYDDGTSWSLAAPTYTLAPQSGDAIPVVLSPRIAPQMIGLGLIEAIPEQDILTKVDEWDEDGDGISGRANYVINPRTGERQLGRFSWKANSTTVEHQVAGAFLGDLGITSPLFPHESCTVAQADCLAAATGANSDGVEINEQRLANVVLYSSVLAPPIRTNADDPVVRRGAELFYAMQCTGCHTPSYTTGPHPIEGIEGHEIWPFTDLLLHDMGPALADGRPDGLANGREWRTPPLWGIGLFQAVNDHTRYLHDGRARSLEEALLWHGGEAEASQQSFLAASAADRSALIIFLESL